MLDLKGLAEKVESVRAKVESGKRIKGFGRASAGSRAVGGLAVNRRGVLSDKIGIFDLLPLVAQDDSHIVHFSGVHCTIIHELSQ